MKVLRTSAPRAAIKRVRTKGCLAMAVISLMCACAQIPDLGPSAQPRSPDSFASRASFDAPSSDWPSSEWWRAYADDQLDSLMTEALSKSSTLAQATARVRESQYRAGLARANQLPSLSLNAAAEEEKLTYKGIFPANAVPRGWNDLDRVTLDFSWELDFWGKNSKAFEAAVSQVRVEQAQAAAATVLLTTNIAQSYVQLQELFVQLDLARDALANRRASENLVRRRFEQGLETQATVEQASARSSQAAAQLAAVDESLRLSRNALAALVGQGPDRGLQILRSGFSTRRPFGLPAGLSADLIGRKPEVVAARWQVEAAAKRVGVARTAFYPNVNLVAFIGFESLGIRSLGSSGSDTGAIGPAVHLPIFDGGRIRANYGTANAQYDQAVAIYDGALNQALHDTADAARSLQALDARLTNTQAALVSGEKAYRLAKRRYEEGMADFQSVLTTEDAVVQIRQSETQLRARGVGLDITLIKALGGGFVAAVPPQAQVTP
jgi:NodT family efflux transporter outer membrane factor (OMF) lipoprotein